jgi:hypothetical protein
MDSKHALAEYPPVVRRRRVAHWLALTALGALALIYRHTFDVHSSAPAVGCRMSGMKEDPEQVWDRVSLCLHHHAPRGSHLYRLYPVRTCRGRPAMTKRSALSSPCVFCPSLISAYLTSPKVPLDYSEPSGPQAAIAMLKVPSKIPRGQEGYRGPILFNPGGPGGSGVGQFSTRPAPCTHSRPGRSSESSGRTAASHSG